MNPNNPYAAPQTVQPLTKLDDLPAAEDAHAPARRILFPEASTEKLERYIAASNALWRVDRYWIIALLFNVAALVAMILGLSPRWLLILGSITETIVPLPVLLLCCCLIGLRVYAGLTRSVRLRYFSLVFDLLPLAVTLYFFSRLAWQMYSEGLDRLRAFFDEYPPLGMLGVIIITANVLPFASVKAHLLYERLFGHDRYRHEEMIQELIHRWKYRIL